MVKRFIRKMRLLGVFVIIITMLTPSVMAFATGQEHNATQITYRHSYPEPMGYYTPSFFAEVAEHSNYFSPAVFNELNEPDPAIVEAMQNEQANLWRQDPHVQAILRFDELRNSSYTYSSLPGSDRQLILTQLSIAEGAFAVANELFFFMEQDGLSLADSIDVMVIISNGMFTYEDAQMLIANIPDMVERNTEIMRFEQLVVGFDLPYEIGRRRLVNIPNFDADNAERSKTFASIESFFTFDNINAHYSFIEAAEMLEMELLGLVYEYAEDDTEPEDDALEDDNEYLPEVGDEAPDYEVNEPDDRKEPPYYEVNPPDDGDDLPGYEMHPHEIDDETPRDEVNPLASEEEFFEHEHENSLEYNDAPRFVEDEYYLTQEEGPAPEKYLPEEEPEETPEQENQQLEQDTTDLYHSDQTRRRSREMGLERTIETRPWASHSRNQPTPEYLAGREAIRTAFTSEDAFNTARQMFLNNHGVAEIETAFAIGAALQVEPETFMLPPDVYRAKSAMVFSLSYSFRNYSQTYGISELSSYSSGLGTTDRSLNSNASATPITPTPPRATRIMSPHLTMDNPFDVTLLASELDIDAEEVSDIIQYGMKIIGFGIQPMNAPITPNPDEIISNPFGLRFNANDTVSLNTGAAMYRTNILSLPGRGGFGFNLDMVYNSTNADVLIPTTGWLMNGLPMNSVVSGINPHGLGVGWTFDLPYISHGTLYAPGRGSFGISGNTIQNIHLNDMRIVADRSFTSGTLQSTRRLDFHDGTQFFFHDANEVLQPVRDDRELIIGKRDRFGNTIRFEYQQIAGFGFGSGSFNRFELSRIIDSNGKHINFQYQSSGSNRTITITGPDPDGGNFVINMSAGTISPQARVINSIQNQVGAVTRFTYERVNSHFDFFSQTPSMFNETILLRQVTYPSGARLHFEYRTRITGVGRVGGARYSHPVRYRWLDNGGVVTQRTTFEYVGDPSGFPHNRAIFTTHEYTTTVNPKQRLAHGLYFQLPPLKYTATDIYQ